MVVTLVHVSIHTPVQGVTAFERYKRQLEEVSIHTPVQGVTASQRGYDYKWQFQSTLPCRE